MLKGGAQGPALVLGRADDSLLYRLIAGHTKPQMPMAPLPPLSAAETNAIKTWINEGAAGEGGKDRAGQGTEPPTSGRDAAEGDCGANQTARRAQPPVYDGW